MQTKAEPAGDTKVVARFGAVLKATNVRDSTTGRIWKMIFEVDPQSAATTVQYVGSRAFGVAFAGVYLGEGANLPASGSRASDAGNTSKIEIIVPEFGSGVNQINSYASKACVLVGEAGQIELSEMQMTLDLTSRADDGEESDDELGEE